MALTWLKAFTSMRHSGRVPMLLGWLKRTKFDYAKEVGDGIDSSVVTAPVQWVQRAFTESRLQVVRPGQDGARDAVERHDMVALINRPNPFYGDKHLWSATVFDYLVAGNAYWLKVRNHAGRVIELWYAPHWTMTPKWPDDGNTFISHYEYKPGGSMEPERIDDDDVVHFRHGMDPRNIRMGLSPLHGVLREIFMDLEASNFVASLLRNMGVPGAVVSPDGGAQASPDDVEAVKKWFRQAFGGDNRGGALVMSGPTKVQQYGFNPQQMDLSVARDVAEERVCASIGIPAAVVGFGAGLQTAKVGATMEELAKLAWRNGIIPLQVSLADELNRSLLPDFTQQRSGERHDEAEFDNDGVKALEDDLGALFTRMSAGVQGGWLMVSEAREAAGFDVEESHRIFLRPFSAIEVHDNGALVRPLEEPEPAAGGAGRDGNGQFAPSPAGDDDKGTQAAGKHDGHTPSQHPRHRPSEGQRAYVDRLVRLERPLIAAFSPRLVKVFEELAAAAAVAARPFLEEDVTLRSWEADGLKGPGEDEILVGRIMEQLELPLHAATFRQVYEAHYLQVAEEVAKAGELVGLATDLPDPVARAVVAAGGRRSGLVDLTDQSRRALFDALAEGRAAGEGAEQLAQRIAYHVEAGPWGSSQTRALTIARTETKFAQNTSTMALAQANGVERFLVFDGRLGPGRSDPDHIARDGSVVTADQAAAMTASEHPNGTLSLAPFFEEE